MAALDGFFPEALDNHGVHRFNQHRRLGKTRGDDGEYAPHVRLRKVHGQPLDDDQRRRAVFNDPRSPVVHGGHGKLRDRAAFGQQLFAHGDGFGQIQVIPMPIALHAIAARIQTAGNIHHRRAGMPGQKARYQPVQHNGTGNHTAVHGRVPIRKRKIIIQARYDFLCLLIPDRAARAAFLCTGIERLQHGFRHAGKRDLFVHSIAPLFFIFAVFNRPASVRLSSRS